MEDQQERTKSLLKPCPKCQKPNQIEARICVCGFWFTQPELSQQTSNLQQTKRERLTRAAKKYLILGSFVIFCGALAAFLGGFIELPQTSKSEDETNSLSNSGLNPDSSNNPPTSRPAKGMIEGTVIAVNSGETITVVDKNNQKYEIRLGGIDAPEPEQDFGGQAKENLAALILNKSVSVNLQRIEDNGVMVGKVLFEGRNINLEQIKAGFAWHNKDNANLQTEEDRQFYAEAENAAKTEKIGLWSNVNPVSASETAETAAINPETEAKNVDGKPVTTQPPAPNSSTTARIQTLEGQTTAEIVPAPTEKPPPPTALPSPSLIVNQPTPKSDSPTPKSESRTTNSSGNATARCGDGTLSYSASRSGACSNHGGVAAWLNGSNSPTGSADANGKKTYILGSRGGCYYINSNGKKNYVDQSLCKQL